MADAMTYRTFTPSPIDPPFVDHQRDDYTPTAWAWCLHLRVPVEYGTEPTAVADFHQAILQATDQANTWLGQDGMAAACGGDSFTSWAEPFPQDPEDDLALHVYFGAPDEDGARLMAVGYLALLGMTQMDVALSTAGDWAEQLTIPPLNV